MHLCNLVVSNGLARFLLYKLWSELWPLAPLFGSFSSTRLFYAFWIEEQPQIKSYIQSSYLSRVQLTKKQMSL